MLMIDDRFVAREANDYKAEGFSRQRVFISMNRNKESSLPGITSMPSISRHARLDPAAAAPGRAARLA